MAKKNPIGDMPHSLEAEQALLGCLLLDTKIQIEVSAHLSEEDFYAHAEKYFAELPVATDKKALAKALQPRIETFDQIAMTEDQIGDSLKFVKENEMVKMLSHAGQVFAIEPPLFVELEITATEPGIKGDTATNATKPATLETGAEIRVPLFINEGDRIRIDTRTSEYMERA